MELSRGKNDTYLSFLTMSSATWFALFAYNGMSFGRNLALSLVLGSVAFFIPHPRRGDKLKTPTSIIHIGAAAFFALGLVLTFH